MTWHIEEGTPERIVQALCGHAPGSRTTQKKYVFPHKSALKDRIISLAETAQNENKTTKYLATNGNKGEGSK